MVSPGSHTILISQSMITVLSLHITAFSRQNRSFQTTQSGYTKYLISPSGIITIFIFAYVFKWFIKWCIKNMAVVLSIGLVHTCAKHKYIRYCSHTAQTTSHTPVMEGNGTVTMLAFYHLLINKINIIRLHIKINVLQVLELIQKYAYG